MDKVFTLGDSDRQFWVNSMSKGHGKSAYYMTRKDRETGIKVRTRITRDEYERLHRLAMLEAESIFQSRVNRSVGAAYITISPEEES